MRTRIKICGLTRVEDVRAAVAAGADAIGFVFYPPSPRSLSIEQARQLVSHVPPFVTSVGLFVNEDPARVRQVLDQVPLGMLQFHGEEDDGYGSSFGRPWMKAARVRAGFDLIDYAARFPSACGVLVDAWVDGYGGGGEVFDWALLPQDFSVPLVLAGGLTPANVASAVVQVRPWAVDVSSGVEVAKGIKARALMEAFVAGVRKADGRE